MGAIAPRSVEEYSRPKSRRAVDLMSGNPNLSLSLDEIANKGKRPRDERGGGGGGGFRAAAATPWEHTTRSHGCLSVCCSSDRAEAVRP